MASNLREKMDSEWAASECRKSPSRDHKRAIPSMHPVASKLPSADHSNVVTYVETLVNNSNADTLQTDIMILFK